MIRRFSAWLCRQLGHSRDWPEMELCCRCGIHMPLPEEPDVQGYEFDRGGENNRVIVAYGSSKEEAARGVHGMLAQTMAAVPSVEWIASQLKPIEVSTHHVHRGPESLPCLCKGTSDHPIGQENP